jgi:hypothetical protein
LREGNVAAEVFVEVIEVDQSGKVSPGRVRLEELSSRVSEVGEGIADVALRFRESLLAATRDAEAKNDGIALQRVELSFRLALKADFGMVVTKVGAEASFEVRLHLQRPC